MANLSKIPTELSVKVLEYLPMDDVLTAIHASPTLRRPFLAARRALCSRALTTEVNQFVLPLALAVYHAQRSTDLTAPGNGREYTRKAKEFCKKHLKDTLTVNIPIKDVTIEMTLRILAFYRFVKRILPLVTELDAGVAVELNDSDSGSVLKARSFYMHELARIVVPYWVRLDGQYDMSAWYRFWSYFSPFVFEGRAIERYIRETALNAGTNPIHSLSLQ